MPSYCCPAPACSSPDCLQLTERETKVCDAVCGSPSPIAFSTIRREVGFHQEIVSRILKRLVNHRAIEKIKGKYRQVGQ